MEYVIEGLLGSGGFSQTYAARELATGGAVALKRSSCERLERECAILSALSEVSGVPKCFGVVEHDGNAYLKMELICGESLKTVITASGRLDYNETAALMLPVLDTLCGMHAAGYVHRDVAPDNIILSERGARLIDFAESCKTSGCGGAMAKQGYSPIEQYSANGRATPASDVYAAAATMYAAMTGFLPPDARARRKKESLRGIAERGIALPGLLEAAVRKGLAVLPERRFLSMNAFITALEYGINE